MSEVWSPPSPPGRHPLDHHLLLAAIKRDQNGALFRKATTPSSLSRAMAMRSLFLKMVELLERTAKRLGGAGVQQLVPYADKEKLVREKGGRRRRRKRGMKVIARRKKTAREAEEEEDEEGEVWRRTIMMGEKCQPLEFSGVIYYDADGQRVMNAPRSPFRSMTP